MFFTGVCLSTGGGVCPGRVCVSQHAMGQTPPPGQTPPSPGQTPLPSACWDTHPPLPSACWDTHTPPPSTCWDTPPHTHSACWDTVNKRVVRIPLECILVELSHYTYQVFSHTKPAFSPFESGVLASAFT